MANTLLVNGTDLTRYDRTIMLADWGSFLGGIQYRGDDVVIPGMPGVIYGGRVASARSASVTIELTGNTAANTWASTHAQMVTDFLTNLATLKTLTEPTSTPLTLTVNPAGTTCLAVRSGLDVTLQAEFWADVTLTFDLLEGTL
jgi:hypothetical protein